MHRNIAIFAAAITIVLISAATTCADDQRERFEEALRAVATKYESWSGKIVTKDYLVPGTLDDLQRDPWSHAKEDADTIYAIRLVRAGDLFRYDREYLSIPTSIQRTDWAWDGKVFRQYDSGSSRHRPTVDEESPRLPHTLIVDLGERHTSLGWLFGFPGNVGQFGVVDDYVLDSVTETTLGQHACWKVQTSSDVWQQNSTFWFSKTHDLLPVRWEDSASGRPQSVFWIESFRHASDARGTARWFPDRSIYLLEQGSSVYMQSMRFVLPKEPVDVAVFSKIDLSQPAILADELQKAQAASATAATPAVAVAPAAAARPPVRVGGPPKEPPSILTKIPPWLSGIVGSLIAIPGLIFIWLGLRQRRHGDGQKLTAWHHVRNTTFVFFALLTILLSAVLYAQPSLWLYLVPTLLLIIPLTWLCWRRAESTEKATPLYRVRTIAGLFGASLTLGVFVGLCFVPTWWKHGVAAALAGVVGLLWIAVMQCFIRSRRFSIMSILSLATCFAMIMSGYQGATQQIRARQRMMDRLEDIGGFYDGDDTLGYNETWGNTPEGLLMHRQVAFALGAATFLSVEHIEVPAESFIADNVRRWHFDDVKRILVKPWAERDSYVVSANAIKAIPTTCPLRILSLEGGVLDEEGLIALKRFKHLKNLEFNLDGQPVPALLPEFNLDGLEMDDVKIDRQGTERLANMSQLKSLTLRRLRLAADAVEASEFPTVDLIALLDTQVTPDIASWLGKHPREIVHLVNCTMAPEVEDAMHDIAANQFVCHSTLMTDQQLLAFAATTGLTYIHLVGSRVTPKGMDQFSKQQPDVEIRVE